MYHTLEEFLSHWAFESADTQKLMDALTDASLSQPMYPGGRNLGRLAWHIAQTIPEMMNKTGLAVGGVGEHEEVPSTAVEIAHGYASAALSLVEEIKAKWTDLTLTTTDDMYGFTWTKAMTLAALMSHQIHHRGQMTVLMRQAGLRVPGVYGPAKEEWEDLGMEPPLI
ncbi:DinB family protein [Gemmatimonas sp.]|jgi:uncharacterized damage-inducible protein DinB|uniref:DinB family protein n=1 Tax=Gemmatimonas sp. TaxID=1962908 RepID=UPI0022C9C3B3|nr:DinB family protein [Gemmatimonas sp.]MCA2984072.1 hypothetical protein [Gemmatimonas sp.]MCA2988828.1 hypothetical protein [Gemmatimonas sp.]MCA2989510.1 hypothetical protein [Gemmatimonas sp.]MCA2993961.1 hypothetical protein [Gemmatimonas sp.]MCE2955086.1 DinB family protein [Gemmatimonas sp.]